jgi:hypothetical protein
MDQAKLTWRSFADPGDVAQGPIAARWNLAATPTLYVIDHKGVIRHKWLGNPGEKAIDAALEKLIDEAEDDSPKANRRKQNRDGRNSQGDDYPGYCTLTDFRFAGG